MKVSAEIRVEGIVQGVGYRWYAERKARELRLYGTAQNLDNGNVLIRVEGDKSVIEEFIIALWAGPSFSEVKQVHTVWGDKTGVFKDFTIIH